MTLKELENKIKEHMLLGDEGIIKLLCAYVVSLRMPITPCWLMIIGPSSGGKTMLLTALEDVTGYYSLDDATANALLSGFSKSGSPASLLNRLPNRSFLTFSDFTTVLSKPKETRDAFLGLLRVVHDGKASKPTGQGVDVSWHGTMGVLGGSTDSYHTKVETVRDMGERILLYNFKQPSEDDLADLVLETRSDPEKVKEEMKDAFRNYLDQDGIVPETLPVIPTEAKQAMKKLAKLATAARSAVKRHEFHRDQPIVHISMKEQVPRFLKELMAITYGLLAINIHEGLGNELTAADMKILYSIALDSIPIGRRNVMVLLASYGQLKLEDLATRTGLDPVGLRIQLDDLRAHKVVKRFKEAQGQGFSYSVEELYLSIIREFEYLPMDTPEIINEEESLPEQEVGWSNLLSQGEIHAR